MTSQWKIFSNYIRKTNILSLKYTFESENRVEQTFWFLVAVLGSYGGVYIVVQTINSWSDHPVMTSKMTVDLDSLPFPAVTLCPRGNTRLGMAERLGNALDPDKAWDRFADTRHLLVKHAMLYNVHDSQFTADTSTLRQTYYDICGPDVKFLLDTCETYGSIIGYSNATNTNLSTMVADIYDKLKTSKNMTKTVEDYFKEVLKYNGTNVIVDFLINSSSDWQQLEHLYEFQRNFLTFKDFNWHPKNLGTFYVKGYLDGLKNSLVSEYVTRSSMKEFSDIFILPGTTLSLLDIADLFTINDFGQLQYQRLTISEFDYSESPQDRYMATLPETFRDCFQYMLDTYYTTPISEDRDQDESMIEVVEFMEKSPCLRPNQEEKVHVCDTYCRWHEDFLASKISREELYSIMRLSLPQRKVQIGSFKDVEKTLAAKLFGSENLKGDPFQLAPVPLPIFCKHRKNQEWLGDDIGTVGKMCSDFFVTPTDVGMCLTKNLVLDDIIEPDGAFTKVYDAFEGPVVMADGGTYWGEATIVIDTNAGRTLSKSFSRDNIDFLTEGEEELGNIQFQLHDVDELAQLLHDPVQDSRMKSIKLVAGNEYTIEIEPTGRTVTERFRKMPTENQDCRLKKMFKGSVFKHYKERNCRYDCKVRAGHQICGCIPWDFIHALMDVSECDLFGRTCFHNVINNVTHSNTDSCPECLESCQIVEYKKKISKMEAMTKDLGDNYHVTPSKYYTLYAGECYGQAAFCDFLIDPNRTLEEEALHRMVHETTRQRWYNTADSKFNNLIVLHLKYTTPKIELTLLDSRMSIYDKVASLGGVFGIITQLTGCSFITMLHMILLYIKAIYSSCSDIYHHIRGNHLGK
jgi:hypothetical protein